MNNGFWEELKQKFFRSGSPVMLYIGINAVLFIVISLVSVTLLLSGKGSIVDELVDQYLAFPSGTELWLSRFYTVITYQFFHADFFHILFNMLWLYWMGQLLLDFIKPRQFHVIYIGGGILGALFFAFIFNLIPVFKPFADSMFLKGSSAAVMAIFTALVTLVPNYSIRLMFIGEVKIKYLLLAYILLDYIGIKSSNVGGHLAHLGGALFGFIYIKTLQHGTDLNEVFKKKPKMKVVRNENQKKSGKTVDQKEIDAILDKISKSGYDQLTSKEKQTLFEASKN